MSYDEFSSWEAEGGNRQIGICEKENCMVNPSHRAVLIGQPFDMWVEYWGPLGKRRRRTVVIHRDCNDRADHTKDWV
jgi:hypothetical protein